ncbi:hypothetical protein FOPE_03231 [Fonsecaea pedrosoi]|nr:hypothetical protein FOPE_03231 [Fonsecaea pedrosoi]
MVACIDTLAARPIIRIDSPLPNQIGVLLELVTVDFDRQSTLFSLVPAGTLSQIPAEIGAAHQSRLVVAAELLVADHAPTRESSGSNGMHLPIWPPKGVSLALCWGKGFCQAMHVAAGKATRSTLNCSRISRIGCI